MNTSLIIALIARLAAAALAAYMAHKKGQNVWARGGLTAAFPVLGLVLGVFAENHNAIKDLTVVPKNAQEAKELLQGVRTQREEVIEKLQKLESKLENSRNPVRRYFLEARRDGAAHQLAICDANLEKAYRHCERHGLSPEAALLLPTDSKKDKGLGKGDVKKIVNALEHVKELSQKKQRKGGLSIMDLLKK